MCQTLWLYLKLFPQTTVQVIHRNGVKMKGFLKCDTISDGGVIQDWEQMERLQNIDRLWNPNDEI